MTADNAGIKVAENILTPSGQIISSGRFDINGNGTGWYFYNYNIRQSTTAITLKQKGKSLCIMGN